MPRPIQPSDFKQGLNTHWRYLLQLAAYRATVNINWTPPHRWIGALTKYPDDPVDDVQTLYTVTASDEQTALQLLCDWFNLNLATKEPVTMRRLTMSDFEAERMVYVDAFCHLVVEKKGHDFRALAYLKNSDGVLVEEVYNKTSETLAGGLTRLLEWYNATYFPDTAELLDMLAAANHEESPAAYARSILPIHQQLVTALRRLQAYEAAEKSP